MNRFSGIKDNFVKLKRLRLPRGLTSLATSKDNVMILRWLDYREVHTASTHTGLQPTSILKHWDKKTKTRITLERPFSITEFNDFMRGVDLSDRMVAHYPHGFKNKK